LLTNTSGIGKRWTVNEALNWIVFRVEPNYAPTTAIPRFGPFISANVIAALAARVARNPRTWPRPNAVEPDRIQFEDFEIAPAYYYRALVRRWITKSGLPASELLDQWTADRERYLETTALMEDQQAKLSAALSEINEAAAASKIMIYGRPADNWQCKSSKPREVIPAHYIDEIRSVDAWGHLRSHYFELDDILRLTDQGPFFADVAFDKSDILKNWPKPLPTKLPAPPEAMIKEFWVKYVAQHDDPDKHPTVAQQKLDADDWFKPRAFSRPSDKRMMALRSSPPTPEHWTDRGRPLKTDR
jgi:hypothetical protein